MNQLILYILWICVAFCMFLYVWRLSVRATIGVPNTPSGPNNEFKIISGSIATLKYFCIFNRSENRVFDSVEGGMAWNGGSKGISGPVEVYVYQIEAVTRKQ